MRQKRDSESWPTTGEKEGHRLFKPDCGRSLLVDECQVTGKADV
jgi:hypothetical protein